MTTDEFLSRLQGVKKAGGGWMARCPAHDDREQSLSVSVGDDDRILLICHAGCDTEAVLNDLGLSWGDLFVGRRSEEPEATYQYTDADGRVLYEVLRYPGKQFRQRHLEGGEWVWNMQGVDRVLYRLPEVLEAVRDGRWVFVVEGEKDADAIGKAGSVATTNVGGANAWKAEYNDVLRGAHVTVVADNDEPGIKRARSIAAQLAGVASTVRLVRAREGKDAYDHLKAGWSLREFVPLDEIGFTAAKAADWYRAKLANPPDPQAHGVLTPWPGLLGHLRPGRFHLLGGYPADGKTAISLQFLRTACESGKRVDFFSIEMTAEELVDRIVAAYGVPYLDAQSGRVQPPHLQAAERALADIGRWDFAIHDEADMTPERIEEIVAARQSDLVVIDHVHAFGHKDRHEVEETARGLKALAKRQKVPALVLAHLARARKFKSGDSAFPRPDASRLRESGMLEAWADTVWFVWRERDAMDLPTDTGELIVAKSRFTQVGWQRLVFDGNHQRWEGGVS